jgi:Ca2+-binding EF-hand superfamily protein
LRAKLQSRGARGIIGLGKSFRIMDDNNSRSLDVDEFGKAIRDYKLGFSLSETKALYDYFDVNGDGEIDYDEFLRNIRGPMPACRTKLVLQAFDVLDKDGSGWIDIDDLKGVYNGTKHPDVISGKKSEDDVLLEFLETFETHHNIANSEAPDHVVTKEEFQEYYENISSSIDNDEYFELMMNNAWKMNSGAKKYGNGWSNSKASGRHGSPYRPGPKAEMKFTPGAFQTSA